MTGRTMATAHPQDTALLRVIELPADSLGYPRWNVWRQVAPGRLDGAPVGHVEYAHGPTQAFAFFPLSATVFTVEELEGIVALVRAIKATPHPKRRSR